MQLKTPEQCYRFLQDVCSYSELSAMEQRYNIAEMLVDKRIYTEIMDKTGASSAIISRVKPGAQCRRQRVARPAGSGEICRKSQKMNFHSHAACRPERHAAFCHPTGKQPVPAARRSCAVFLRRKPSQEGYFYE